MLQCMMGVAVGSAGTPIAWCICTGSYIRTVTLYSLSSDRGDSSEREGHGNQTCDCLLSVYIVDLTN